MIAHRWNTNVVNVVNVLNASERSPFKYRLLHSVLDGVLDCDKLDYVRRDSVHLGVSFGLVIDHERLFRNLTTIWGPPTEQELSVDEHHPGIAEIGVAEKAFVVAKSLLDARKDMFRQVYWQHTTRTLKAMLGFVVRDVLTGLRDAETEGRFWADMRQYIANPGRYYSPTRTEGQDLVPGVTDTPRKSRRKVPTMPISGDVEPQLLALLEDDPADFPLDLSNLDPSDDSLLTFLWSYSSDVGKGVISSIRSREIFERVAVISPSRNRQSYEQLYEQFRQWRLARNFGDMEKQRKKWEEEIKNRVVEELQRRPALLPSGFTLDRLRQSLDKVQPLILIDVPIKATSKRKKPKYIRFVREDPFISHRFHHGSYPQFESFEAERDETAFDIEVGKIRLLSDHRWRDLLIWVLGEELRAIIVD